MPDKPNLLELPKEWKGRGPFGVYAGEIYDHNGTLILKTISYSAANDLCHLLNAADAQKGGE